MDLQLQDKVAVVTGGASGIGEAIVRVFAGEGAQVVVLDRDAKRGKALAGELAQAHFIELDLCSEAACESTIADTLHQFGRIDALVNNAGSNDSVGIERGIADFEASLRKNLSHYYMLVHFAADALRKAGGSIVNIGSKVCVTGQGGTSGYAAAKGAINGLTREWAADFAADGVRVNAVMPAEVWTPMYEQWLDSQPDGVAERERISKRIPLENRFTTATEIANTVVFLASAAASHITGQILHVDGGYVHLDRRLNG